MKINMQTIEGLHLKHKLPSFRVGDQVRVTLKIVEGESERLQAFEGTVIGIRGQGLSQSFKVRKVSYGVGVERTFPFNSPRIEKLEVVRSGHVRRAKLFFLRERTGRAARLDEKVDRREGAEGVVSEAPAKAASVAAAVPAPETKAPHAKAPAAPAGK